MLVQQFNAVESLSNVDVLCTDKTGTLTSGVVTYEELAGLGARRRRARGAPARRFLCQHDRRQPDHRGGSRTAHPAARLPAGTTSRSRAGRTYGRIVRDNVFNFINNLFYFLGILLLILGKPLDAFAVVFVIAANTVISLFQEIRAKRVMDKMAILLRPKADVLRDGAVQEIDPSLVVLGDVLRLEPGDQVVVDGPMVGEGRMEVDESLLTGESDLVTKHPGDELMSGSFCMTGGGYYEAAQVGLDSFANKLTAKATAYKRELTPLQRQVVQIVRVLLIVVIVFEILVWVRNVIGGVPFVESVRMSTVILALIPNGLVLSIALTYALGAVRLLGKDVLVQQFNAVESLSNVDVLCTDKTGTLTSGVVTFEELAGLAAPTTRAPRACSAPSPPARPTPTGRSRRSAQLFRRSACRPRTRRSSRPSASGAASPSPTARRAARTCSARPRCSRRRWAPARTGARRPTRGPRAACASCCSPGATSRSPSRTIRTPRPSSPTASGRSRSSASATSCAPACAARWRSSPTPASTSRSSPATTPRRWSPSPRRPACRRCGAARAWTRTATW